MTGLAFAFLLVLLASIVSRSGREDNVAAADNTVTNAPNEPLAELGVAPGATTSDGNASGNGQ